MKYRKDNRSYEQKADDTAKGWLGLALVFITVLAVVNGLIWLYEFLVK